MEVVIWMLESHVSVLQKWGLTWCVISGWDWRTTLVDQFGIGFFLLIKSSIKNDIEGTRLLNCLVFVAITIRRLMVEHGIGKGLEGFERQHAKMLCATLRVSTMLCL